MEVVVRVTEEELEELGMTTEELHYAVVDDLDDARDYPGFNVTVELISEE